MKFETHTFKILLLSLLTLFLSTDSLAAQCPKSFKSIALPKPIKLCRDFSNREPAAFSFFSSAPPAEMLSFFNQSPLKIAYTVPAKNSTAIIADEGRVRIILNEDNGGTSVNILVSKYPTKNTSPPATLAL